MSPHATNVMDTGLPHVLWPHAMARLMASMPSGAAAYAKACARPVARLEQNAPPTERISGHLFNGFCRLCDSVTFLIHPEKPATTHQTGCKKRTQGANAPSRPTNKKITPMSFTATATMVGNVVGIGVGLNTLFGDDGGGGGGGSSAPSAAMEAQTTQMTEQSKDLFDYHKANYRPLEVAATADAMKAGSEGEIANRAGTAGATVAQQFSGARRDLSRNLAMYGGPTGGNAQERARLMATDEAGATAGAENLARQEERAYGLNSKVAVANMGRGIVGNAIAAGNSAATAAQIASSTSKAEQDMSNTQNANIGSALTAIGNGGSKLYDAYQRANPQDTGAGRNATENYNGPSGYWADDGYRKGGLVRPKRARPVDPPHKDGYEMGGAVRGPGDGTSDSIPVVIDGERPGALSTDEYVLNTAATKKIGLKRLDRMNLAGLPKGSLMRNGRHLAAPARVAA